MTFCVCFSCTLIKRSVIWPENHPRRMITECGSAPTRCLWPVPYVSPTYNRETNREFWKNVCVCVCVCVYTRARVCVCVCVWLSLYVSLSVYILSVHVCTCILTSLSLSLVITHGKAPVLWELFPSFWYHLLSWSRGILCRVFRFKSFLTALSTRMSINYTERVVSLFLSLSPPQSRAHVYVHENICHHCRESLLLSLSLSAISVELWVSLSLSLSLSLSIYVTHKHTDLLPSPSPSACLCVYVYIRV